MNEQLLNYLTCGDVHPNVLGQYIFWGTKNKDKSSEKQNLNVKISEHFCAWVEEVIVPLFKNESNICKFPKCLADDIKRQVRFKNKIKL